MLTLYNFSGLKNIYLFLNYGNVGNIPYVWLNPLLSTKIFEKMRALYKRKYGNVKIVCFQSFKYKLILGVKARISPHGFSVFLAIFLDYFYDPTLCFYLPLVIK